MENLYALAIHAVKSRTVLETMIPEKHDSPLRKLANIVFSEKILTDEECMLEIYGKKNVTAFSRLKARLVELVSIVLILQVNIVDDWEAIETQQFNNLRKILVGKVLLAKRSNDLGLELLEKSIAICIKYNFTENVLISARNLINGYGSYRYNKYKYEKYTEIQKRFMNIYFWEIKAESYFFDLQKNTIQSLANPTKEQVTRAHYYIKELEKAGEIDTPAFNFNKYRINATYCEYTKDFEGLLRISNIAIQQLDIPNITFTISIPNIYIRKIWALIQSGKSVEAVIFSKNILPKLLPGTNTWFRLSHYALKAYLYTSDYKNGIILLNEIFSNSKFKKLENYYTEIFNTTLGYFHLVSDAGLVGNDIELMNKLPDFKIGKFLNTTPTYSKDKRGINVSILLMHVAFLLLKKDYNSIIDKTDSLNQYAYRYLRRDDSFRSNCMIKMVIQMAKADFNPVRTQRYTEELLKDLKSVNLAGSGENIEIEVIPFEVLWDIMLETL